MDPFEYIAGALPWWDDYVLLFGVSAVLHWVFLLKRRTLGFFDPLFFVLLGSIFGWAIVWFMYWRGDIAGLYVASFTIAELAFCAGLYVAAYRGDRPLQRAPSVEGPGFAISIFFVAALMHTAATLATWAIAGIPLFRVTRLGAFADTGGLGIIERLSDAGGVIALFAVLYLLIGNARTKWRVAYYAFLAWYAVAIGLSGSKSALLTIGQCAFAVAFLYTGLDRRGESFWGGRVGKLFIGMSVVFAVAVLGIQQGGDLNSRLLSLVYRLVNYGDIYILAYPNASIEDLRGSNALIGLFGGFLSTFRLFPADQLYPNIGFQFTLLTFPDLDYVVGPNPRHPVFGYHYFGAFAFVYSFVLGVLTSRLQKFLYFTRHRHFLGALIAFLVYFALVGASVDVEYSLTRLASVIIAFSLVVPPALLLFPRATVLNRRRAPAPPVETLPGNRLHAV